MTLKKLVPIVVAVWFVAGLAVWFTFSGESDAMSRRGQFGDMFGAVNALFTGLAFAGVYSSLKMQQQQAVMQQNQIEMQRNELALQREELALQREEMKASRAELANQVAAQQALFRASAAQITVAGIQAEIEALKLFADRAEYNAKPEFIFKIQDHAKALKALGSHIEESVK